MKTFLSSICLLVFMIGFQVEATSLHHDFQKFFGEEFKEVIKKEFPITADGTVDIESRHGKLTFQTWDQNRVSMEVTIKVVAKNRSVADDVFDRIRIKFSNDSDFVGADTHIENQKKSWWKGSNNAHFEINYLIKMPASVHLEMNHRYGGVSLTDMLGNADLELHYGEMNTGNFGGSVKLELRYSNVNMQAMKNLEADIRYSELRLTQISDLDIESGYSSLYLDAANQIDSETSYDDYNIGQVSTFTNEGNYDDVEIHRAATVETESRYSHYYIEELSKNASFDMVHGSLSIKNLEAGFETLDLRGVHTGFQINIADEASYQLKIESEHSSISYPNEVNESEMEKDHSTMNMQGHFGSNKNSNSRILLETRYGHVNIK